MTALEALSSPHVARLTARDFLLLDESGAFANYARSELIEGEIFVVNAQHRRHARVRGQMTRLFEDALAGRGDSLGVLDECSVAFDDLSIPQPDIVLTVEPEGEGPIPIASVRLIVEVADTTLTQDLGRKQRLYASHAIPEYWVADLGAGRIVRMWAPKDGSYSERDEQPFGFVLHSATLAGIEIDTNGLS